MKSHKLRSTFTRALVAAALAIGFYTAPAAAATHNNVGPLSTMPYVNAVTVPAGSFLDTYSFSIFGPHRVAAGSAAVDFMSGALSFLHISNLSLSLYDSGNNFLGSQTGVFANMNSVNIGLPNGNYRFDVAGTANGLAGGVYAFSIAAVPEPEQWALFAAGLGLLGVMSRRRANRS